MSINLSAIGMQAAANLTALTSGQAPDGDGDHGVEPAGGAGATPANSTVSFYA